MIAQDRWAGFCDAFLMDEEEPLLALREEAIQAGIPIIRRETAYFLRWLIQVQHPENILEIGTGVGYSALYMLHYAPEDARLVTIENYERRIPAAEANFAKAEVKDRVAFLTEDAAMVLPTLGGTYELVFLDAAKAQYITILPELIRLLGHGGMLVTDNIAQDGETLSSRYAVRRRDRTIHKRMREYLYAVTHDERLLTELLPVGDGIAVSVRRA